MIYVELYNSQKCDIFSGAKTKKIGIHSSQFYSQFSTVKLGNIFRCAWTSEISEKYFCCGLLRSQSFEIKIWFSVDFGKSILLRHIDTHTHFWDFSEISEVLWKNDLKKIPLRSEKNPISVCVCLYVSEKKIFFLWDLKSPLKIKSFSETFGCGAVCCCSVRCNVCCSVLQSIAVCFREFLPRPSFFLILKVSSVHVLFSRFRRARTFAVCCSVLQRVACIAANCSVLQCVL